jgi:hypothetical protein
MALESEVGRTALDIMEVVKTRVATELMEARGNGFIQLNDEQLAKIVRTVSATIDATAQNCVGQLTAIVAAANKDA